MLVSCLCVTERRAAFLRRAIDCFLAQGIDGIELIIQCPDDDVDTRAVVDAAQDPRVRLITSPAHPRLSLGVRRNLSLQAARGRYIATWDDDDWYSAARLQQQLEALQRADAVACLLKRELLFDRATGDVFVSGARGWENSLLALREAMRVYPDVSRGEDSAVVQALVANHRVALLDAPSLYVRTCHAGNTVGRAHWEANILPQAQRLDDAQARQVREWIRDDAIASAA